jgi:hypothetical protein
MATDDRDRTNEEILAGVMAQVIKVALAPVLARVATLEAAAYDADLARVRILADI